EVGKDNVAILLGSVGTVPSAYPINVVYLFTGGPEEAVVRVAVKRGSGMSVAELKELLRESLPRRLGDWLRKKLEAEGLPSEQIARRVAGIRLSFEPADIVNEVMSF